LRIDVLAQIPLLIKGVSRDFGAALTVVVVTCSSCLPPPAEAADASKTETAGQSEGDTGNKVITVVGPIAMIDGKRISRIGHPIKVAPGCHVVRTDQHFVTSNNQVTVYGTVTPVDFVLHMREGYNYYVERQVLDTSSQTSPVRFTAYEREASNNVVQTFGPTRDAAEIHACNANAPAPVEP
jgi:hypothetical protein